MKGTPVKKEVVTVELLIQRLVPFKVYKEVALKGGEGYVLTDADATQF